MSEIERWSIERLSQSLANPHTGSRSSATSRPSQAGAVLAAFARGLRHFSGSKKRRAGFAKAR